MEDDNVDIYDDINDFDLGNEVERLKAENGQLRENIRSLEGDAEKLMEIIAKLRKNQETLTKNISSLHLTAKAEIDRKDRMISDLRTQNDDICFRRFKPGIQNKRWIAGNFSEGNIAKRFKYDDTNVSKTKIDEPNDKHESDSVCSGEIKDDITEDYAPKTSKCEVDKLRNEHFYDKHRERSKSRSVHSGEREGNAFEDVTANKFQCDNKRRREELGDRWYVRNFSRSRPDDRYNNDHENRSRSRERHQSNIENGSRYNNNFSFRGEKDRIFEDREYWNDNRDTRRRHDNRDFSTRDFKNEYSKTDRTGSVKKETPPNYEKDRKINENEKIKRDDKPEKISSKIERVSKTSKDTVNESSRKHTRERVTSENENSTKVKPEKKRLKMLERVEKKIRKMRVTPIKTNSTCENAPALISGRLKKVSRDMTQELDNDHDKKSFNKVASELSEKEDSRKMKHKGISQHSKMEVNQKDSSKKGDTENIVYINLSDEEKESVDQDLIIIDECSNLVAEDIVTQKAEDYFESLSEDSGDEVTKATIQDVNLAIKYHTESEIPFQLSKDLSESTKRDRKLTAEIPRNEEKKYVPEEQKKAVAVTIIEVELEENDEEEKKFVKQDINVNIDADNSARDKQKQKMEKDKRSTIEDSRNAFYESQKLAVEDYEKRDNDVESNQYTCSTKQFSSMKLAAENAAQSKEILNSPKSNEEWKDVELHGKQNINVNSVAVKFEDENVENTPKEGKNENKKKINILSNIDVTPPPLRKTLRLVREENTNGGIKVENQPIVQSVPVMEKKEIKTKMKSSLFDSVLDAIRDDVRQIMEKDSIDDVDSCRNQDTDNTEKSSIVNLNAGNFAKNEKIKSKQQHKSILKEFIMNHAKRKVRPAIENPREEENKNIKLPKQDINSVKVSLNINSYTVDKKRATEVKIKSSPKEELTDIMQEDIIVDDKNEEKENVIQSKKQDVNANEKREVKKIKMTSLPNLIDEKTVDNSKEQAVHSTEECSNVDLDAQNATKNKERVTNEKIKSSPTEDLTNTKREDRTVRNKNEERKSVTQFKKQDINVNAKNEAKKIKKTSLPNITEEKTAKNSKQQDVDSIEECSNVNATNNKETITKEKLTCVSGKNEEMKGQTKNGNKFRKKDGINEEALNVEIDTENSTRDERKENNKKIKSPSPESVKQHVKAVVEEKYGKEDVKKSSKQERKQDKNLEDLPSTTKHMKPTIDDCIKEEMENSTHSKKRNSGTNENSINENLAKDKKKEIKKNYVSKEDLTNSSKQGKNLDIEKKIGRGNTDIGNTTKDEKEKIKRSTKGDLSSASKQDITDLNIKDRQKNIKSENQDLNVVEKSNANLVVGSSASYDKIVATEKKNSSKKYLPNVEGNIKEESKETINKTKESSNVRLVVGNGANEGKKEPNKKTRRPSKEHLSSTTRKAENLTIKSAPQDLTNTDRLETGEKKHSKMQDVNTKRSCVDSDVENISRDGKRKKRSASKEDFTNTSEDTKKNKAEDSKESTDTTSRVNEKFSNVDSDVEYASKDGKKKKKSVSKNFTSTSEVTKKKRAEDSKESTDTASSVNKECANVDSDVENTSRDGKKKKKSVSKNFTDTSEDTKKNKAEDSKESTDTASSVNKKCSNVDSDVENASRDGEKKMKSVSKNFTNTSEDTKKNKAEDSKESTDTASSVKKKRSNVDSDVENASGDRNKKKKSVSKNVTNTSEDTKKNKAEDSKESTDTASSVNKKCSNVDSDVENASRDREKKMKSVSKNFTNTSEDTKKNKAEDSKESTDTASSVKKKRSNVDSDVENASGDGNKKRKSLSKNITNTSEDTKKNKAEDSKESTDTVNKKCSNVDSDVETASRDGKKKKKSVSKNFTNASEDMKKNKKDDLKESTDTASSEETVHLKVMKLSDMRNILRGSLEESAAQDKSTKINTKEAKKEFQGLGHDDKYSTREAKKNFPEAVKNEKSRKISESGEDGKSKEHISDTIKSEQAGEEESFEERFYALVGSYSDDSDVVGGNGSVNRSSVDRENVNDGKNIVERTDENRVCDVNREKQKEADKRNEIEDNNMISKNSPSNIEVNNMISKNPPSDVEVISRDNLRSNATPINKNTQNATPEKPQARRRITPTPVKSNRPICSFENILGKPHESPLPEMSPLHLTHDGEIPVLHLEENHISNLPTETNINDKNLINLLDTMNISNMECDIPKITCEPAANSGDSQENISPIKGSKPLTFENVISKVTSTPVPKNKCQSEKSGISNSTGSESFAGGATSIAEKVSDNLTPNNTVKTNVQSSATIRRRRRCRMVVID